MNENYELYNADCLQKLKELPEESVDLVLSDFPYGLGFMGKAWDKVEENFYFRVAEALMPVMKSGSFLVTTFTPRQDMLWRLLRDLEKAGFELKHSGMYWLYHTGFPKASDVAKNIDKQKGLKGKKGKEKIAPDGIPYSKRQKEGHGLSYGDLCYGDYDNNPFSYLPESEEAINWFGWKSFSLKPAVECVVVAQKPKTEKTIVGQVLKNGCGAVNVEACRIPTDETGLIKGGCKFKSGHFDNSENTMDSEYSNDSRFPANLLVSEKNVLSKNGCMYDLNAWAEKRNITLTEDSMFFDVPKPSKAEKNLGCDGLEAKELFTKGHGNKEQDDVTKRFRTMHKNNHPTCKPVKLFCYLSELFCQSNGVVLDPFMGSGTTGVACAKMNKRFIGIEKNKEYFVIAEKRIVEASKQTKIFKGGLLK